MGAFNGTIDADPGPGTFTVNSQNSSYFITMLNQNGDFLTAFNPKNPAFICSDNTGNLFTQSTNGSQNWSVSKYGSIFTGITTENKIGESASIFPNPGNGFFHLSVNDPNKSYKVEVYDLNGRKVHNTALSSGNMVIDLHDQPVGLYLIRINDSDDNVFYKKLVKN